MRGVGVIAFALALALAAGGCGGSSGGGGDEVIVSAASSLKVAFGAYREALLRDGVAPSFSFAGSDELAAQIRGGVRPDVFAAANTKLPDALRAAGLVDKPVVFATNRLVLAVGAKSAIKSLAGVERPGVTVAIGAASVPVGSYTRDVLGRLAPGRRRAILANVRSEEPDVAGIVGKLTQGSADAGFVYVTDVRATGGRLRAIELPAALRPRVAYAAAVVRDAPHADAARRFVAGLLTGAGAAALREAGFGPPP